MNSPTKQTALQSEQHKQPYKANRNSPRQPYRAYTLSPTRQVCMQRPASMNTIQMCTIVPTSKLGGLVQYLASPQIDAARQSLSVFLSFLPIGKLTHPFLDRAGAPLHFPPSHHPLVA